MKKHTAITLALAAALTATLGIAPVAMASSTPALDLGNPAAVLTALAPDQLQPVGDSITVKTSPSRGKTRALDATPQTGLVVSAPEYGQTTSFAFAPAFTNPVQSGDFLVQSSADRQATASVAPTPGGAQIVFAAANQARTASFSFSLPLTSTSRDATKPGALRIALSDGSAIHLPAPTAHDATGAILPARYVVTGQTVSDVVSTNSKTVFPLAATTGWSYTKDYGIGTTTPLTVQRLLEGTCFNCYFPVSGAPKKFPKPGQDLPLTVGPWSFHCTFGFSSYAQILGGPIYAFEFDAAKGHVDGLGSTIEFEFFKKDGESTYSLEVYGYIVNSNPAGVPRVAYLAGAQASWFQFAQNLSNITITT